MLQHLLPVSLLDLPKPFLWHSPSSAEVLPWPLGPAWPSVPHDVCFVPAPTLIHPKHLRGCPAT